MSEIPCEGGDFGSIVPDLKIVLVFADTEDEFIRALGPAPPALAKLNMIAFRQSEAAR